MEEASQRSLSWTQSGVYQLVVARCVELSPPCALQHRSSLKAAGRDIKLTEITFGTARIAPWLRRTLLGYRTAWGTINSSNEPLRRESSLVRRAHALNSGAPLTHCCST